MYHHYASTKAEELTKIRRQINDANAVDSLFKKEEFVYWYSTKLQHFGCFSLISEQWKVTTNISAICSLNFFLNQQ
jgi:hypothetical protein